MSRWFWYFIFYSLGGCGLEKLFALAIGSEKRRRKCFLLLPLCPVYGLAMCLTLALIPEGIDFWVLSVLGAAVCTAAEYLVHLFYDRVLGVRFWDYGGLPGNLGGRVCPQFAVAWGLLSAWAAVYVQPAAAALAAVIPRYVTFAVWETFVADSVCTLALLGRYHDTELVSLRAARALSQSQMSR